MSSPFNMLAIISMYAEILFHNRAVHICWMENNLDGHLLKVLVCFFLYLESSLVTIFWKVSKKDKKD